MAETVNQHARVSRRRWLICRISSAALLFAILLSAARYRVCICLVNLPDKATG